MAGPFVPFENPYGDPLEQLDDEERKRFLEQYAPSPVHTGAVTRGAQGFAPLPVPRGALAPDREGLVAQRPPTDEVDADLMRRFADAQSADSWKTGISHLGSMLDGYARTYAGLDGNRIVQDRQYTGSMDALRMQEAERARQRNMARQQDLDAVNLAKTRAETQRAQASAQSTAEEAAREAALARIDSPETAAQRKSTAALLAKNPHVTPELLASLNGLQLRELARTGTSQLNAEVMAGYRSGQQDLAERRLGLEEEMRRAGLGLDQYRAMLAEKGLALDAARLEAERQKLENPKGSTVSGYEFAPGAAPTADDAKKVKASLASASKLKSYIAELKDLYRKHGTKLTGPVAADMRRLARSIELEAKTVGELGALTGPDLSMVRSLANADPASLSANIADIFGLDETEAGLRGLEKWTDASVGSTLQIYGYRPAQGGAAAPTYNSAPQAGATPPSGMKSSLTPATPMPAPQEAKPDFSLEDTPAPTPLPTKGAARPKFSALSGRVLQPPRDVPAAQGTSIPGSGSEDDPYVLRVAGKPAGYIQGMLSDGEVAYVRDLDGGRMVQKVNGKVVYVDGKPKPNFKAKGK